jgi:hypothetical protein
MKGILSMWKKIVGLFTHMVDVSEVATDVTDPGGLTATDRTDELARVSLTRIAGESISPRDELARLSLSCADRSDQSRTGEVWPDGRWL